MSNSGEWLLTVVNADAVKGFDLFSKSDLYVKITVGDQIFQTNTCRNNNAPVWNQTFSFPMNNMYNNIEIRVMDDDVFRDDKIAVANIYPNQLPTALAEEKDYSVPLSYKNKDIGILHIRIKNNGNNMSNFGNFDNRLSTTYNQSSNNATYNQGLYNSTNYNVRHETTAMNVGTGGYDSTVLGGHSYDHNNNNNTNIIRDDRTNYNNVPSVGNDASLVAASAAAIPAISSAQLNESKKKHKKDKKDKKHKHHKHGPKVALPEKHHHYEDGYTSSTSESSNEGEKRRAAEGKLGKYAYEAPLNNNDPYLNNTVDANGNLHTHGDVNASRNY